MSPRQIWVLVSGTAAVFAGAGYMVGVATVKNKLQKEYAESSASMRRAYEALKIDAETPVDTEEDLITLVQRDATGTALEGGEVEKMDLVDHHGKVVTTLTVNPYHQALEPDAYASYAEIDEEEYFEEDGRVKEQIVMVFDDGAPRFFQGSEEIADWSERLSGSIVDDMRAKINQGDATPTVYVRNNQSGVDYEVIFEYR